MGEEIIMKSETLYPSLKSNFLKGFKVYTPKEIRIMRKKLHLSVPKFADMFFACKSTIKKWESGDRVPSCSSMRLLQFVETMANEKHQDLNHRIRGSYK